MEMFNTLQNNKDSSSIWLECQTVSIKCSPVATCLDSSPDASSGPEGKLVKSAHKLNCLICSLGR